MRFYQQNKNGHACDPKTGLTRKTHANRPGDHIFYPKTCIFPLNPKQIPPFFGDLAWVASKYHETCIVLLYTSFEILRLYI